MNLVFNLEKVFKPSLAKEMNLDFYAWKRYHVRWGKKFSMQIALLLCCFSWFSLLKPIW